MDKKRFQLFLVFFLLTIPLHAQFNGDGLKGTYYINTNLTSGAVTEVDPTVSYRWYGCPPQPGMSGTSFSVQWLGQVEPAYSEAYTIYADVAGAVSVIVNGQVLASHWTDTGPGINRYQGTIALTAGAKYSIEVDYFTNGAVRHHRLDPAGLAKRLPSGRIYPPPIPFFGGGSEPHPHAPDAVLLPVLVCGHHSGWRPQRMAMGYGGME